MTGTAKVPGRGRKAKPTARKKLAGNPGKRALNNDEPEFSKVTNIEPPEWMTDRAQTMWGMLIPELLREKVLCITDLHNVEAFCSAYDKWRMAEESVQQFGIVVESSQGSPMKNPALTAANEAMRQMATFGALLGLDPSSRGRLTGGKKKTGDNPFASLLG
tara:strand:+ start:76 stop:558 length:483 start_codon:yes stop_codon:yes gene_type:complete